MKKIKYIILLLFILITGHFPCLSQPMKWEVIGEMPGPVYDGVGIVLNSKIYILGGYSQQIPMLTDTIRMYDPVNQLWNIAGRMQNPRASFIADKYNENIVLIGGVSGDSLGSRNVEMWSLEGSPEIIDINESINRINATGAILDQIFYIFGGYAVIIKEDSAIPYIIEYNISTKSVIITDIDIIYNAPLPYQQSSVLHGEDFYLFGGVFFVPSKKINKFNIENKKYERIYPDMLEPRAGSQAVLGLGNDIYIIGGFNEIESALASIEIFRINPSGYQIEYGPPLNYARKEFMAVYYNESIYVFGGINEYNQIVPYIEKLNLATDFTKTGEELLAIKQFKLYENYPNPFNAGTTIKFDLNMNSFVRLDIFSLQGRLIKTLVNTELKAGLYQFRWDGTDVQHNPVASNIYMYKLTTDNISDSKKMILVK